METGNIGLTHSLSPKTDHVWRVRCPRRRQEGVENGSEASHNAISCDGGGHHAKRRSSKGNGGQMPYAYDGRKEKGILEDLCAVIGRVGKISGGYEETYAKTGME